MFNLRHFLSVVVVITIVYFPTAVTAYEQVSPVFNDTITYFPLANGKALVLSGTTFYQANNPTEQANWQKTNLTYERPDELTLGSIDSLAVSYHGYDYVSISLDKDPDDLSFDAVQTEVWRLSRNNPANFERVLKIDSGTQGEYITDLVNFRGVLYMSTVLGNIWRTVDGVNWVHLTTAGLPAQAMLSDFTVMGNKLYVLAGNAMYMTKNGGSWHAVNTPKDNTVGLIFLTKWQHKLWAVSAVNESGLEDVWGRIDNNHWTKILVDQPTLYNLIGLNTGLYLPGQKQSSADVNEFKIKTTTNGTDFSTVYSGVGWTNTIFKVDNEVVAIVSESDTVNYLIKL